MQRLVSLARRGENQSASITAGRRANDRDAGARANLMREGGTPGQGYQGVGHRSHPRGRADSSTFNRSSTIRWQRRSQRHANARATLMHNLVSAAAATGVNRSTILRAIKAGRISGQRDETNGWEIDPAELHRVFPPLPSSATTATQLGATTDALVAELRAVIADLRRDRDAWREAFENAQRLLPRPTQPDAIAVPGLSHTPPAAL